MKEEIFQECLRVQEESVPGSTFWPNLAKKFGYKNPDALRSSFKREKKRRGIVSNFKVPAVELPETESTTYTQTDDYINIICSSKRIKTKEDIIKEFEIDENFWKIEKFTVRTDEAWRKDRQVEWQVEDGKVSKGDVKDSGKILVVPLVRLDVRFIKKTLQDISSIEIAKSLLSVESLAPPAEYQEIESEEILEINISDLHIGSDANSTNPDSLVNNAIGDVIFRTKNRKFKKIYIAFLGDIFHYDNYKRTTTGGTLVETDSRSPFEMFDIGLKTIITILNKLKLIAPVEALYIAGNHDKLTGYTLLKAVEMYFSQDENVTIDAGHHPRKHRVIGNTLVGWMHGDMPKSRSTSWLQVEAREEWGKTKYSEIHSGNFHSQSGKEDGGVILRYLPGLTRTDAWHTDNGYVGAVKSMVSFVWDVEKGLREILFSNV